MIKAEIGNMMRRLTSLSLSSLMLLTSVSCVFSHGTQAKEIVMQDLSDDEIISALSSQIPLEAHHGVKEIFHRGERMIPLLLKRKGDKREFHGYGFGNPLSAFYVFTPQQNTRVAKGSVITVEVAALYLISGIYYKTLEFAEAPYLTDGSNVRNLNFNTSKRVSAAWASVEKWSRSLEKAGMQSLRSTGHSPLKGSLVYFWGKRD